MNKKVIGAALLITFLCVLFKYFEAKSMLLFKTFLESSAAMTISIIFVLVSVFCYTYFIPDNKNDDIPLFIYNGIWILEFFLNISTYIAVTSTAINLIKAIYLQKFYGGNYFGDFGSLDIYTMADVSSMLLWFSLFKCWQMLCKANSYCSANETIRT